MKRILSMLLLPVLLLALVAAGCSTVHETTKETKKLYREWVEPQPDVDLDTEDMDEGELKLARLFKPVDEHINALVRYVYGTDSLPKEDWFKTLFTEFSWISGVIITDVDGVVRFQHPQESLKQHDLSPFMEYGEEWSDHKMRSFADATPLGPEIYMANPFFEDSEWKGLVVVHFDPRKLLRYCPDPDELIIVGQEDVLWPGNYEQDAQALAQKPWEEILDDTEFGSFEGSRGEYHWIARHLGYYYIIYAVLTERMQQPAEE